MELREYELVMLISPQLPDEEVPGVVEGFSQFITQHGGSVSGVRPWGKRRLAYHIGNFEEAHYVQSNFTLAPKDATELQRNLTISEQVIRHLMTKVEPKKMTKVEPKKSAPPSKDGE